MSPEATEPRPRDFETLAARRTLDGLDDRVALEWIGQLVDLAGDRMHPEGLKQALAWCDGLERRNPGEQAAALTGYFRANAWANLQRIRHLADGRAAVWSWEQPEAEQQILALRAALHGPGIEQLKAVRKCQVLTNLGNVLNAVGRFVEALELWDEALGLVPQFWMARGNRGLALTDYARALHDPGHRDAFHLFAHRDLVAACASAQEAPQWGDPPAAAAFALRKADIEAGADVAAVALWFRPGGHAIGRTVGERSYRTWCLRRRLFLNPLNDLAAHSVAAADVLSLPDFVAPAREPPVLTGFFNQLKQEFASARWALYEGATATGTHFSDRGLLLHDTLDYPAYGLATERTKTAFRTAYSLLDKIAFFINHYFGLGIDANRVSFRAVWREKGDHGTPVVRESFQASENWPLRGLFWLSKDLFDEKQSVSTEPDSRALHELRNYLEHRYVKVHELGPDAVRAGSRANPFHDTLAYSISRESLDRRTLRLLKMVRAALIYLALAMRREEGRRQASRGEGLVLPISLDRWRGGSA